MPKEFLAYSYVVYETEPEDVRGPAAKLKTSQLLIGVGL